MMLTPERIRDLFDHRDGKLYWRRRSNSRAAAGQEAGTINSEGYRVVTIDGKNIHAHRLVWLWHGQEFPPQIDHINGDRLDNRMENLRVSDYVTNAYNSKRRTDNKSGVKGVSWCNTHQRWVVQLYHDRKKVWGRFKTLDEAKAFADSVRQAKHGEFARSA